MIRTARKLVIFFMILSLKHLNQVNSEITSNYFVPGQSYGARTHNPAAEKVKSWDVLHCARQCSYTSTCLSFEFVDGGAGVNCFLLLDVGESFGTSGGVFWDKATASQEAVNPCLENTTPVYTVHFITFKGRGKTILCSGQWLIMQKRSKTANCEPFNRTWAEYKDGFGVVDQNDDLWTGNEYIYEITKNRDFKLKISMKRGLNPSPSYEEYGTFYIENEAGKYALHVSDHTGMNNAFEDSTITANSAPFSAIDQDNDYVAGQNCAADYKSGWWFSNCQKTNLNGLCADQEGYVYTSCQQCRAVQWAAGPPVPALGAVEMAIAPQSTP